MLLVCLIGIDALVMADPYSKIPGHITIVNANDFFTTWYDTNLPGGKIKQWVVAMPPEYGKEYAHAK